MAVYGYGNDARALPIGPSDARAIPVGPGGYGNDARAFPAPGGYGDDARAIPQPDPAQAAPDPSAGWIHPSGAFAPGAEPNAPRLINQGGQWILTEHGNQRVLQPNEIPMAQGYVSDFWQQFPNGQVWGSGHANDPYTGNIPFPAGVTPDPALMKPPMGGGEGSDPSLYQPGPNTTMGGAAGTIGDLAGIGQSAYTGQGSLTSGPGNWGSSYAPMAPARPAGGALRAASFLGGTRMGRPPQNTIGSVANWGGGMTDPLQVR